MYGSEQCTTIHSELTPCVTGVFIGKKSVINGGRLPKGYPFDLLYRTRSLVFKIVSFLYYRSIHLHIKHFRRKIPAVELDHILHIAHPYCTDILTAFLLYNALSHLMSPTDRTF